MNPVEAIVEGAVGLIGTIILLHATAHFAQRAERAERQCRELSRRLNYSTSVEVENSLTNVQASPTISPTPMTMPNSHCKNTLPIKGNNVSNTKSLYKIASIARPNTIARTFKTFSTSIVKIITRGQG